MSNKRLHIVGVFFDRGERNTNTRSITHKKFLEAVDEWKETEDVEDDVFLYWVISSIWEWETDGTEDSMKEVVDEILQDKKNTVVGEEMFFAFGKTGNTAIKRAFWAFLEEERY